MKTYQNNYKISTLIAFYLIKEKLSHKSVPDMLRFSLQFSPTFSDCYIALKENDKMSASTEKVLKLKCRLLM